MKSGHNYCSSSRTGTKIKLLVQELLLVPVLRNGTLIIMTGELIHTASKEKNGARVQVSF